MKGVDYSFGRPSIPAIKAAGYDFVMRYCPYRGDGGKGLTAAEAAELRANGLAIGVVFESVAARHLSGFAAGQADAVTVRDGLASVGAPSDLPVYFAVDFDAQPSQMAAIDDYHRGAGTILGLDRIGVYGSNAIVAHCHASGSATWFWQTYAWSHGQNFPARHLYQYDNGQTVGGAEVDLNEAYGDEQGFWKVEDDEMSAEDKALLQKILKGTFGTEAAMDALADNDPLSVRMNTAETGGDSVAREQIAALSGASIAGMPDHTHSTTGPIITLKGGAK